MNEDRRIDRLRGGLLGAALLLAPACQVVAPDDGEFHFHSRTYAMGKYVRHGFIVNDEPVLQEKADVGWGPWTLKTHLNYDTEKRILDQRFAGLEFGTDLGGLEPAAALRLPRLQRLRGARQDPGGGGRPHL